MMHTALKKKTTTLAAFEEDVQWAESGGMVPSEYHGTNDKAASFSTSHQNTDVEHSIDLPNVSLAAAEVTMSPVMVPSEYHETNDKAASFSTSHQNTDVEHSIDLPKVLLAAAEVTMSPVMVQSEYHETNDKAASFSTSHQNTDVEHSIDLPKVLLAAAEVTMSPVMVQSEYHETNDKAASFSTSHQNTDVEHSIDLPEVLLAAADVTMSPVKFYFPATDEEIALEIGLIAEPVNEPDEMDINDSSTNLDEVSKPLVPGNASVTDRVEDSSEPVNEQEEMDIYDSLTNSEEVSKPPVPGNASVNDRVEDSSVPVNEQEEMDINDSSSNSEEVSEPLILGNASVDDNDREEDSETDNDFNLEDPETDDSYGDPLYKPRESDMDEDIVSGSEDSDNSTVIDFYPAITGSYEKTQEEENIESLQCTEDDDVVASAETSTQSDECDLVKTLQPSGDTNSHTHSNLPEETICRDRKFPCIYIRKGNSDHGGEKKRVYDNYHCCLVCKQLKSNIRKHILSHKEHPTVKRMIQNEGKNQKEKERLMAIFRNAGDNAHNVSVCHEKKGELIVSRRVFPFDYSEYGPCSDCLEWIKMGVSATKHLDKCPASTSDKYKLTKGQMVVRSNVIKGLLAPEASEHLIANVYPIMTRDEVTEIAQKDSLIVALGNFVFRQNINNKSKRKYTTSSRMRAAARLVKFLKEKHGSTMSMSDFLNVDFFDDAVEAALNVASPNNDDLEDLKHPSAAIKAGHDIFQLADIQVGIAVQARNNAEKEEVEGFILLLKKNWSNRVGRLAKKLLRERRMLSHVKLPNPTDLQHLAEYLKEKLDEDYVSYRTTAEYSLCRLLLYNKRRSGELENTLKVNYIAKSSQMDEYDEALMGDLTELEKKILGSQELMKIEGKGQQIVPVIIPTDTTRALQYITNDAVRKSANVKEDNPYLFATTGSGPIRAYEALKRVCDEVKVTTPDAITSVNLRKYFATMTQVIGLKDHELGWLCKHLGHSVNVHKLHYRAASGYIERMNIGKLMLLQDFNVASHFKDQRLEDIHVEDILKHAEHKETTYDRLESLNDLESEPQRDASSLTMNSLIGKPKSSGSSRKKQVVRTRWTEEEEKELRILFKSNLQKCECPSKEQIAWAIGQSRKEGGKIHLRNRDNIKKKVWNMYQSKKSTVSC